MITILVNVMNNFFADDKTVVIILVFEFVVDKNSYNYLKFYKLCVKKQNFELPLIDNQCSLSVKIARIRCLATPGGLSQ